MTSSALPSSQAHRPILHLPRQDPADLRGIPRPVPPRLARFVIQVFAEGPERGPASTQSLSRKSSGALETGTGSAAKRRCLSPFPGRSRRWRGDRLRSKRVPSPFPGGAGVGGGQAPLEDSRSQSPFPRPRSLPGQTLSSTIRGATATLNRRALGRAKPSSTPRARAAAKAALVHTEIAPASSSAKAARTCKIRRLAWGWSAARARCPRSRHGIAGESPVPITGCRSPIAIFPNPRGSECKPR